ncbi:hypothetical protein [Celeribacter halophilus]|uniref:hypothetical protein n=1 Tax=Celeribacter halophilus TaxID=576117 RepID=UPI003A91416D
MPLSSDLESHARGTPLRGRNTIGRNTIARNETGWGYCLMCGDGAGKACARIELALRGLSFLCFLLMAGLWLWPGSSFAPGLLGIKLGLSIALGGAGLALGHFSERGLRREVQIDQKRKQLRIVWRNRHGQTRLHTVIGFDEIGSIFLRRSQTPVRKTHMDLRFGARGETVTLFEGEEAVLRELWRDLHVDLHADELAPAPKPFARTGEPAPKSSLKVLPRALR